MESVGRGARVEEVDFFIVNVDEPELVRGFREERAFSESTAGAEDWLLKNTG